MQKVKVYRSEWLDINKVQCGVLIEYAPNRFSTVVSWFKNDKQIVICLEDTNYPIVFLFGEG